jgi:hypothetical protein
MAKPDPEEMRRMKELSAARRREADEIFARYRAKIAAWREEDEKREERRRRILRRLTFRRAS